MKKLVSMLLAGAMVFALAIPALAEDSATGPAFSEVATQDTKDNTTGNASLTMVATTNTPTIKLKMPKVDSKSAIIINPYGLKYVAKVNGASQAEGSAGSTDAIISPIFAIENSTNAKLKATATVTAKAGGNLKLVDDAEKVTVEKSQPNNVYAEVKIATAETTADGAAATALAAESAVTAVIKTSKVEIGTTDNDKITLAAVDTTAATVTPNYLVFQFGGDAADAPVKPWAATDTLSIEIVWSFTPEKGEPTTESSDG